MPPLLVLVAFSSLLGRPLPAHTADVEWAPAWRNLLNPDALDGASKEVFALDLQRLLRQILYVVTARDTRCVVIITDDRYWRLYDRAFFESALAYRSVHVLHLTNYVQEPFAKKRRHSLPLVAIRAAQCGLHFITIADAAQTKHLLQYADENRALSAAEGKFVFLHDQQLLESEMWPIWCNMLSSIFLQRRDDNSFTISGIPFPDILKGVVLTRQLLQWRFNVDGASRPVSSDGAVQYFSADKVFPPAHTDNLRGVKVRIAVYEHVPMVMVKTVESKANNATKQNTLNNTKGGNHTISSAAAATPLNKTYIGLEVEIMRALARQLNFTPVFYAPPNSGAERWGRVLPNGSHTGLIAELTKRSAEFAIGDLHLYALYTTALDLSWPHTYECLTFLTPESSRDDSWRTLIQPFSGGMWAGVLLSHLLVGSVFYVFSYLNALVQCADTEHFFGWWRRRRRRRRRQLQGGAPAQSTLDAALFRSVRFRTFVSRLPPRWQHGDAVQQRPDLFDDYANCLLLAYSMLMYVSLPRMPRHWALRVLTGWFWIYCILVTVTYRASLTAILANPAARITIDTLQQLDRSGIVVTTGSGEHKRLFDEAGDELARHVGQRMQIVDDIENVAHRIAKQKHAYYDNKYFLRQLRLRGNDQLLTGDEVLHIMHDCIVRMPVAVGMVRNSPLKPRVDRLLQRLMEGGLLAKWLKDATKQLNEPERPPLEAVMDLRKIWSSFVALALGLLAAACAIAVEHWHYRYVVRPHPLFDKYNRHLYYNYWQRWPARLQWPPLGHAEGVAATPAGRTGRMAKALQKK